MGVIKIRTPDGVKKVRIKGDTPTEEEKEAIIAKFSPTEETETVTEVKETEEEILPGEIQSHSFQYYYGKADTDKDRARRLDVEFGPGTYERKGSNNFVLLLDKISPEKRAEYNLPSEGKIAVNRKGFSRYDLSRFTGAYRGPLVTTLAAGLYTTGIGILPAMGVMFLAGAAGKGLDEYQEHLQGFQTQSNVDVYKDMAIEGALMGSGEGVFRGAFALIKRIWKGPGPKPTEGRIDELRNQGASERQAVRIATEERRVEVGQAIKGGAIPNIEAATGKAFLGRLQAIYEAILPNRNVARNNTKYVQTLMRDYKGGKLTEEQFKEAIDQQARAVSELITQTMKDPKKAVLEADRHLQDVIKKQFDEIQGLIKRNYTRGTMAEKEILASDIALVVEDAARLFKQDSSALYKNAEEAIGLKQSQFTNDLIKNKVREIRGDMMKRAAKDPRLTMGDAALVNFLSQKMAGKIKNLPRTFSLQELNSLRQALNSVRGDPALFKSPAAKEATELINMIDQTLISKEQELAIGLATAQRRGVGVKGKKGLQNNAEVQRLMDGYEQLRGANRHYMKGKDLFESESVTTLMTNVREGIWTDLQDVTKYIVQSDKPERLRAWLRIMSPSQDRITKLMTTNPNVFRDLEALALEGEARAFNNLLREKGLWTNYGAKNLIKEMPEEIMKLPKDNAYRISVIEQRAAEMKIMAFDAQNRTQAPVVRDRVRDMLGNQWIKDTLRESFKEGRTSFPLFADKFNKLGIETQKILFGDNRKRIADVVSDSYILGNTAKGSVEAIEAANLKTLYLPAVRQEIGKLQNIINQATEDGRISLFNSISKGNVTDAESLVTGILKNPQDYTRLISRIRNTQGENVANQTVENIRDITMGRIAQNAFPEGITGEAVITGSFGESLEKTVREFNKRGALKKILGSQEVVDDLLKVAKQSRMLSNELFKGKAGLAAPAFVAAAAGRLLKAPLSFFTELAQIVLLGRLLRNKTFLKWMTSPQLRASEIAQARRLGAAVGDRAIAPVYIRELVNSEVRAVTAMLGDQALASGRGVVGEQVQEIKTQLLPQYTSPPGAETDIQEQETIVKRPRIEVPPADLFLRQQELNKLLGVR